VSFRVSDAPGIAGLITPNSRVDVLVVLNEDQEARTAKLVAQNIRVLALSSIAAPGFGPQRSADVVATVEATPEGAERIGIASTDGQVQLMLRGYRDSGVRPDVPQTMGMSPTTRPDTSTVTIYRGIDRDTLVRDLLRRSKNSQRTFKTDSARRSP
jgi:Flp pilus assembly protein CpaB